MPEKKTHEMQSRGTPTPTEVERTAARPVFTPPTDIYETADHIVLLADMPGVDEKSVDIRLEQGVLTVAGRTAETCCEGYSRDYAEFREGNYERAFTLSDEVDMERIDAKLKDGVLRLVLPKKEAAKPRRIPVVGG